MANVSPTTLVYLFIYSKCPWLGATESSEQAWSVAGPGSQGCCTWCGNSCVLIQATTSAETKATGYRKDDCALLNSRSHTLMILDDCFNSPGFDKCKFREIVVV